MIWCTAVDLFFFFFQPNKICQGKNVLRFKQNILKGKINGLAVIQHYINTSADGVCLNISCLFRLILLAVQKVDPSGPERPRTALYWNPIKRHIKISIIIMQNATI